MTAGARGAPRFYGWRMVAVAFLVDFIAVGFFFYSFGVFFKEIASELGGSRLGVSMGISISNFVGAAASPFLGRMLDRHSIKRFMMAGALFVGAGFGLLSAVGSLWQMYVLMGTLLAFGMSMMGGLASAKLVANWFDARRGTALGIATMGVSLSGLVMPVAATWLIAEVGWRGGFAIYGICTVAIVIPVVASTVVNRPEEMGLRPDGDPPESWDGEPFAGERVWRTREILRSADFWIIAVPFAAALSSLSAILAHMVPYADDLGIPAYRAASVLSASAGAGVLGKVGFGWLVDRIDPRWAVGSSFLTQALGLALIMSGRDEAGLLFGAIVFGFGMGGVIPLHGAVAGRAFGRLSFGKVMGLLRPVQVPLHVAGIPLAGWLYDVTGSYDLAFRIFLGTYLVASLLAARLSLPPGPAARRKPASERERPGSEDPGRPNRTSTGR